MRQRAEDLKPGDLVLFATVPPTVGLYLGTSRDGKWGLDYVFLEKGMLHHHRMAPGRQLEVVNSR